MSDRVPEDVRRFFERGRAFIQPLLPKRWRSGAVVVPVVRLQGAIGMSAPLRPGLSLAGLGKALDRAFETRGAAAVALVINSPGGSPVQSHLIFQRIRQLATERKIPVLAFVEDVAASGGFMLACAADTIICDPSSIVGSIGVITASFGLTGAIDKLGVERRVYTSGKHKGMLDPFQPEKPEDIERLRAIQQDIHDQFIALVKTSRGARLSGAEETLFSGEFWTAPTALSFGLIDGLGDLRSTLRQRYGEDVSMPLIQPKRNLFGRAAQGVGVRDEWLERPGLADEILSAIETRLLWSRFGI